MISSVWRCAGSSGSWCGKRTRAIFRNVQQQIAAHRHVEQLHAGADAEHRRAALGDHPHQAAIEHFAALGERANRRVEHPAIATRIEIGAPHEHHTVHTIEQFLNVFVVFERRNDQWNAADLADRIVIARRDIGETRLIASRIREIGVNTNDWFRHTFTPLLSVFLTRPCCVLSRRGGQPLRCTRSFEANRAAAPEQAPYALHKPSNKAAIVLQPIELTQASRLASPKIIPTEC